jgi:hypothetical protein
MGDLVQFPLVTTATEPVRIPGMDSWVCATCRETRVLVQAGAVPSNVVICGLCDVSNWTRED